MQKIFNLFLRISLILSCFTMFACHRAYALNISTSIKPLGLILTELTQQTSAHISVLIPANQSGHDFSLRPKDLLTLNQADLIVWVGPELESFLQKPIQNLSKTKTNNILTLLTTPSIQKQLLLLRTGAKWQDLHHHEHNHDHNHNHNNNNIDPHIWLSPRLGVDIAHILTKKLISLNPSQAKIYLKNFEIFTQKLLTIDNGYLTAFSESKKGSKDHYRERYLVLHDSFQYLEKAYGLPIYGVLSIHPERSPSIKTLRQAQNTIQADQVTCLLGAPPFQQKLMHILIEEQTEPKPRFVQLFPLADQFELKSGNYMKWQKQLLHSIQFCK